MSLRGTGRTCRSCRTPPLTRRWVTGSCGHRPEQRDHEEKLDHVFFLWGDDSKRREKVQGRNGLESDLRVVSGVG